MSDRVALTGAQRQAQLRERRADELARLRAALQRVATARTLQEVRDIVVALAAPEEAP